MHVPRSKIINLYIFDLCTWLWKGNVISNSITSWANLKFHKYPISITRTDSSITIIFVCLQESFVCLKIPSIWNAFSFFQKRWFPKPALLCTHPFLKDLQMFILNLFSLDSICRDWAKKMKRSLIDNFKHCSSLQLL